MIPKDWLSYFALISYNISKKEGTLMPQFLKFILYTLLPSSFINSYICVRFCTGILTPSRSFFSKNRSRFFVSFMLPITAAFMSKYWFPSMGSWLIQLTLLLLTILYFSDPLKKKDFHISDLNMYSGSFWKYRCNVCPADLHSYTPRRIISL